VPLLMGHVHCDAPIGLLFAMKGAISCRASVVECRRDRPVLEAARAPETAISVRLPLRLH